MRTSIVVILLSLCGICFGQHKGSSHCSFKAENKDWLLAFKKTDNLQSQVDLVLERIYSNTDYFEEHPATTNANDKRIFGTLPCNVDCSILFGLVYSKNSGIILDLHKNPQFIDLISELNANNISRIELKENHKKNIYQHNEHKRSGIVIYTDNKNLKKKIKRAVKNRDKA